MYALQRLRVVLLEEFAPSRILPRRRRPFFVRLVHGYVLVEDVQRLLGGRELDGEHTFAVEDGLGGPLAELRALSVGSAVLVEQRVVAVIGEAEAVVLAAVPAVVEAVAVAVAALDGVDAALCDGALLPHLLLGVGRGLQGLEDAHGDPGVALPALGAGGCAARG